VGIPEVREPRDRERAAQHAVRSARSLLGRGNVEQAEAVVTHGLRARPGSAALHRAHARILDALGRAVAAETARRRADALDPPPGPLPSEALPTGPGQLLIVLLAPDPAVRAERRPRAWPDGEIAEELEQRLRVRLPGIRLVHAGFDSIAAARAGLAPEPARGVISLRVDRIYCGDTVKDGRFGLAQLRIAAERPGEATTGPGWVRQVIDEPRLARGWRRESIARALERALALPRVRELVETRGLASGAWDTGALRALFPEVEQHIEATLTEGRRLLASGRLADALQAFERAASLDPDDPIPGSYVRDLAATLALSRELARRGRSAGDRLDPRMSAAQRAAIEAQLAAERARHEALLAALAVLSEEARLPRPNTLDALTPVALPAHESFGVSLARQRAGGTIRARAALAPDGGELARYYFSEHDTLPLLREEDTDRDGTPDRWIGYAGDRRAEIWEEAGNSGRPQLRLVLAGDGTSLTRVEVDRNADGAPERILYYSGGALRLQAQDRDADGRLDTFDRLAADGRVRLREEDVDGDGTIDIRSQYRADKLVSRELSHARDHLIDPDRARRLNSARDQGAKSQP